MPRFEISLRRAQFQMLATWPKTVVSPVCTTNNMRGFPLATAGTREGTVGPFARLGICRYGSWLFSTRKSLAGKHKPGLTKRNLFLPGTIPSAGDQAACG